MRTSRDGFFKAGMHIMMDDGKSPNQSKIKHRNYHVSIKTENEHNKKKVSPKTFPMRNDVNYLKLNKTKEQIHVN